MKVIIKHTNKIFNKDTKKNIKCVNEFNYDNHSKCPSPEIMSICNTSSGNILDGFCEYQQQQKCSINGVRKKNNKTLGNRDLDQYDICILRYGGKKNGFCGIGNKQWCNYNGWCGKCNKALDELSQSGVTDNDDY